MFQICPVVFSESALMSVRPLSQGREVNGHRRKLPREQKLL